MSIPFTQFLMPNGRKRPASFDAHATIEIQAQELIEAGYNFEVEMLTTGAIHMDCSRPQDDMPVALKLCNNNPEVVEAVHNLVLTAHSYAFPPGQVNV